MPKRSLRERSAGAIVAAIADAAARWTDADFPPRVRVTAAIGERLGFREPVVDVALDRLFGAITRATLTEAIAEELGSLDALDGAVTRAGGVRGFARGVERSVIVASDTTIGVALPAALFALCAKSDVVVKDRSDLLCAAFFATLTEELPEFAAAALARAWNGGDDPDERALLAQADAVVAFGGDGALRAIRAQLPAHARFAGHGRRASIGYLAPPDGGSLLDAAGDALLDAIAVDTILYDGSGCMSLHALFVRGDAAAARALAAALARACDRMLVEFPAGALDPRAAAAHAAARNTAIFRAATGTGAYVTDVNGAVALLVDPPRDEPPPLAARVLPIYPVADRAEIAAFVARHQLPLEALGLRDPAAPDAPALAAACGAVRVAAFGRLQDPPLAVRHGGLPRITDFVRWIDCA